MGQVVGTYHLLDQLTGKEVEATLWHPLEDRHVQDFTKLWKPIFKDKLKELGRKGLVTAAIAGEHNVQDSHWEWAQKFEQRQDGLAWASFAIEADGVTQGLMFARMDAFAQAPTQLNRPIVDIDLLATAPWNRPQLTARPQFKGIGRLLLAAAISLSVSEEFAGRIGLHALPQAETWYRDKCGMTDLGLDRTKMRYFEMTPEQAQAFIS